MGATDFRKWGLTPCNVFLKQKIDPRVSLGDICRRASLPCKDTNCQQTPDPLGYRWTLVSSLFNISSYLCMYRSYLLTARLNMELM